MTRLAQPARRGQPRAGLPRLPGARTRSRRRRAGRSPPTSTSTRSPGARARCARPSPRKFERLYGVPVDPEREITVTCGSTEAMIATLLAVLDPGDEVIVFEPFYENYGPDAILSGRDAALRDAAAARLDASTRTSCGAPSRRRRARSSSTRPTTRPARCSRATSCETIAELCLRARRARHHRRDLRAHPLRRRRARPDGDAARHGRAHDHDQRAEQDLQRHRLARGLGHRAAGAHRARSARSTTS